MGNFFKGFCMKKKYISVVLVILWAILIFMFSDQNRIESKAASAEVAGFLLTLFSKIIPSANVAVPEGFIHLLRSLAHFILYLGLGFLTFLMFTCYKKAKAYYYAATTCFLFSLTDEFHQFFVPGRSAQLIDIIVDFAGAISGILIYTLFLKLIVKIRRKFKKGIDF